MPRPHCCILVPTIPRNPSTLTHSVSSTLKGLEGSKDWLFYIVKHQSEHPEADEVAEKYGLELVDGSLRKKPGGSWEKSLTLDMAWTLELGAETGAEHLLYLEDDIEASTNLSSALYSRTWLTFFFTGLCGLNNWYHPNPSGAVGMLLRNDHKVLQLIDYLRKHCDEAPADALVWRFIKEHGLSVSQRIPNPIQHLGFSSSCDSRACTVQSPTYRKDGKVPPPLMVVWSLRYFATRAKIYLENRGR